MPPSGALPWMATFADMATLFGIFEHIIIIAELMFRNLQQISGSLNTLVFKGLCQS